MRVTSPMQGCSSRVHSLWVWGHWLVTLSIFPAYFSLMLGPLFLRTHREAKLDAKICIALGWSLELLSVGLLGVGGEAPRHHCIGPSVCLCVKHTRTMASSFGHCPLKGQKSHLRFLLYQMGNPCGHHTYQQVYQFPSSR